MQTRRTGKNGEVLADKVEARLELLKAEVVSRHGDQAAFEAAWNAADPDYEEPKSKDD